MSAFRPKKKRPRSRPGDKQIHKEGEDAARVFRDFDRGVLPRHSRNFGRVGDIQTRSRRHGLSAVGRNGVRLGAFGRRSRGGVFVPTCVGPDTVARGILKKADAYASAFSAFPFARLSERADFLSRMSFISSLNILSASCRELSIL